MRDVNYIVGQADLRLFVRAEKVGPKVKYTPLAFSGDAAAKGVPYSTVAICRGMRKRCHHGGYERSGGRGAYKGVGIGKCKIDCIHLGTTRWGRHRGYARLFNRR